MFGNEGFKPHVGKDSAWTAPATSTSSLDSCAPVCHSHFIRLEKWWDFCWDKKLMWWSRKWQRRGVSLSVLAGLHCFQVVGKWFNLVFFILSPLHPGLCPFLMSFQELFKMTSRHYIYILKSFFVHTKKNMHPTLSQGSNFSLGYRCHSFISVMT